MAIAYCQHCDYYRDLDYESEGQWDEDFNYICESCVQEKEEEDDGQPDEAQEWHDYDPDC